MREPAPEQLAREPDAGILRGGHLLGERRLGRARRQALEEGSSAYAGTSLHSRTSAAFTSR